jgi:predicted RNA-binding Zn-ribbon protein involved in translation (DUF1610 family)
MILVICIILIFVLVLWQIFSVKIKGVIGEKTTSSILYFLDKSKYKVINNVVLCAAGKTTQIDHIVISDFGIFVIETKNYKGWILGGENSEYWTQVIYNRKEKFYNPIRQNLAHIQALKNCLREYRNLEYVSIIVFPSKSNIKVYTNTEVGYSHQLTKTIKKYTEVNLTDIDKEAIFQRINALNIVDTYDKSDHVKSIKQRIQRRNQSIHENRCPKCGGELIERNGKFGTFLGCKSYPRCKFTLNI